MISSITANAERYDVVEKKKPSDVVSVTVEQTEQRRISTASDTTEGAKIRSKLFGNGRDAEGNLFPLFLPPLESAIDTASNSLLIGAGSKTEEVTFTKTFNVKGGLLVLTFCGYGLLQSAEIIGGKEYGKTNAELGRVSEEEKVDVTEPLRQLLYAASMENADFGSDMEVNNNILQMLGRIGIDTNRNFSTNNRSFRVNSGVIQSGGI
jgi:hypothetical protein